MGLRHRMKKPRPPRATLPSVPLPAANLGDPPTDRLCALALAQCPAGILILDEKGRIQFWNSALAEISGRCEADLLGKNLFTEFPALDSHHLLDPFHRALAGQSCAPEELDLGRLDWNCGGRTLRLRLGPLRTARGPAMVLGVIEDLTEARRVAGELAQSEARYQRLIDSVTNYVYTVRVKDGEAVSTLHGEGSAAVTGYTPADYLSDPGLWYRMIDPEDRDAVLAHAREMLTTGRART
jgi:PAS domain S-box-containing protein